MDIHRSQNPLLMTLLLKRKAESEEARTTDNMKNSVALFRRKRVTHTRDKKRKRWTDVLL